MPFIEGYDLGLTLVMLSGALERSAPASVLRFHVERVYSNLINSEEAPEKVRRFATAFDELVSDATVAPERGPEYEVLRRRVQLQAKLLGEALAEEVAEKDRLLRAAGSR